jgi:hypothetical protein
MFPLFADSVCTVLLIGEGNVIPRLLGSAIHASVRNSALNFGCLQLDLARKKQFKSLFVVRDDLSLFIELFSCLNPTVT